MADNTARVNVKEDRKESLKRKQNKNYSVKKRIPPRPIEGNNVIFITKKTNFKAQLEKCCDLLTGGEREIVLHGLGAAMSRCCNLALQLETTFAGACGLEINTSTVQLVDDLEPLTDELEFDSQLRQTSAVHIRVYRILQPVAAH